MPPSRVSLSTSRLRRIAVLFVGIGLSKKEKPWRRRSINYGPGYRVYSVQRGSLLIILLCGGDKSRQAKDIASALKLAKDME